MHIKVNRKQTDEALVFEIVVTEPHLAPFSEVDMSMMMALQIVRGQIEGMGDPENKTRIDVEQCIHLAKWKVFNRVLNNMQFAIKNELEPKFKAMCQEVYNWIYDNQKEYLKNWMCEFDPQRTKYYFDNDKNIESDEEDD